MIRHLPGANDLLMAWVTEQGLDPSTLRAVAKFNGDGTITLFRFLTDERGRRYVDTRTGEPAVEPVTITPTRPMPYVGEVGE